MLAQDWWLAWQVKGQVAETLVTFSEVLKFWKQWSTYQILIAGVMCVNVCVCVFWPHVYVCMYVFPE